MEPGRNPVRPRDQDDVDAEQLRGRPREEHDRGTRMPACPRPQGTDGANVHQVRRDHRVEDNRNVHQDDRALNIRWSRTCPRRTRNTPTAAPASCGFAQRLRYADPFTEDIYDSANVIAQPVGSLGDGSQIWEVIHNGVDSHAIHFHLYNVQLLDRVGWDGLSLSGT